MRRHSLAREMTRRKAIKAAVAVLLAMAVTIPVAHVGATLANGGRTRTTDVTKGERILSRQWGAGDDHASSESIYSSPSTSEARETPSKDRQGSAASHRVYRTVCVRLCDGYYFPISFAVPRRNLLRDARRCQESCGAQARLFYHSNANADIAEMTDLEGRPYSKLQSAFLYRTAYLENCKCHAHPWEKEATERHRMYALAVAASKGDKAAAVELQSLRGAFNQAKDKDAQPAPTVRPPASNRATSVMSATISSEKPNAAGWRDKVFQNRN